MHQLAEQLELFVLLAARRRGRAKRRGETTRAMVFSNGVRAGRSHLVSPRRIHGGDVVAVSVRETTQKDAAVHRDALGG